ncbi:hypothetical protein B0H13DRAFT_925065 [Mycena leptocephala]|nr:hypothetical protein B0H13DRAFT_925065 [Mycena leptocephala]
MLMRILIWASGLLLRVTRASHWQVLAPCWFFFLSWGYLGGFLCGASGFPYARRLTGVVSLPVALLGWWSTLRRTWYHLILGCFNFSAFFASRFLRATLTFPYQRIQSL